MINNELGSSIRSIFLALVFFRDEYTKNTIIFISFFLFDLCSDWARFNPVGRWEDYVFSDPGHG